MYLQTGDVLYKKIDSIPKGLTIKGALLHKGESHDHRIVGRGFKIIEVDGKRYLDVSSPVDAVHPEHKTVKIPKGKYMIEIVNEFDHLLEESRKVID